MPRKPDTIREAVRARAAALGLTARVRAAIAESGLSLREIGRRSGLPNPVVSRFVSGERGVTSETLDRLIAGLGLLAELRPAGDP